MTRPQELLNIYDVVVVARRQSALADQRVLQPDKLVTESIYYEHAVAGFYVPHTHACPGCGQETNFASDPSEDGEPQHCLSCLEVELGGNPPVCETCFEQARQSKKRRRTCRSRKH